MRTTIDIEEDVLQGLKERAKKENSTVGKVFSELARRFLTNGYEGKKKIVKYRNGIPQFPSSGEIVTMEHIRKIMDEEGI